MLTLRGHELRAMRGDEVSMVFQEPSTALNPVYTVGWQITEGIRAHGKVVARRKPRPGPSRYWARSASRNPEKRVNYYPHQFSGGQKQRVIIAAALALNPALIVADEPTTALDVTVQAEILELLREVRDDFNTGIVLITHNMGVVADLADRVVVMYQGKVVETAPSAELFAAPARGLHQGAAGSSPAPGPQLGLRRHDRTLRARTRKCWFRPPT